MWFELRRPSFSVGSRQFGVPIWPTKSTPARRSSAGLPRAFRGPSWATLGGPELFRNHLGWDGPATHSKEQRKQQHLMHTRHCRKAVNPWVFLGSWFNTRQRKLKDISAIDTYGDSNPLQKEGVSTVISLFYTLMGIGVLWQMKEVTAIVILFIYLWA